MSNVPFISSENPHLQADCERCFGLCCVALPYGKSSDFAFDKSSGTPCPNLREDDRCGIHTQLRQKGFKGCTVYDCFGAGQKLSQVTYADKSWRTHPESAREMFDRLPVLRQIHELISYMREVMMRQDTSSLHAAMTEAYPGVLQLSELEPAALLALDLTSHRSNVNALLLQASEQVRGSAPAVTSASKKSKPKKRSGMDFLGANLQGADLRGASFRGALMIAANLRHADARNADWIGADLRDTELSGADLRGAIFLTQAQLNAAKGNADTRLPDHLHMPSHWH
ncbi:pentapeptide repeat-containing protein [Paenibacillus silvae]|uniref:pentapeptide repeat-containing protein n=1 Tax=Paenibacillus silvae TaxID=1325358 RepID=UPI002005381A|nr:pentapeptide repeat-containing protein [Paenibacillus silvae]MCK6075137.1 pentapeptide repeat-containing protein [Paenibacillus silvae]MCK6149523.1 pentapeptide repeat-containing protein [Paenibacillus silvae]MCK6267822.1 pentapeptide repeat-containing protein [Paenibacillus silvae]